MDSDMQSRWWDFGGDTIVRTDKYVPSYVEVWKGTMKGPESRGRTVLMREADTCG